MPFLHFIGWIKYDFDECIGPERVELMAAVSAFITGKSNGMELNDHYDILEIIPWSKSQRPMLTDEQLNEKIDRIFNK